jgi:hypothetical protein
MTSETELEDDAHVLLTGDRRQLLFGVRNGAIVTKPQFDLLHVAPDVVDARRQLLLDGRPVPALFETFLDAIHDSVGLAAHDRHHGLRDIGDPVVGHRTDERHEAFDVGDKRASTACARQAVDDRDRTCEFLLVLITTPPEMRCTELRLPPQVARDIF